MSWFGQIAGGLIEGASKGASDELMLRERMQVEQAQARERAAERQQLQTQRFDQQRELAAMREENRRTSRGNGGGGGESFFDRILMTAETPQDKQDAIEYTRMRAGDEAAELVAQRFGMGSASRTIDPSRTSVNGYNDATGGMDTAVPASITMPGMSGKAAEAGRVALNRVLGMASGKYKDFEEGSGQGLVNDAVRGAGGDDTKMRQAGAMAMAVDGKSRFKVDGDQYVDSAGVTAPKQTDLGSAKAQDERAGAAKKSASVGVEGREIKTKEFQALQQERISFDKDLDRAVDSLQALRKDGKQSGETREQYSAKIAAQEKKIERIEAEKAQIQARIREYSASESARGRGGKPDPRADLKPAAGNPTPTSPSASAVATPTTKAEFDRLPSGTRFKAPDGSVRVKP